MGVQGLWEVVNKAGQSRSLSNLAVIEGFEKNHSGNRAFRIGIGTVCTAKWRESRTPPVILSFMLIGATTLSTTLYF